MAIGLEAIAEEWGVSVVLLVIIFIWTISWKLAALWKAARKKSLFWFIVLALINTVGILEILYIFVLSELEHKNKKPSVKKKSVKKKK